MNGTWRFVDSDGKPIAFTGEFGGRQPGDMAWFAAADPLLIAVRQQEQPRSYKPWSVVAAEYLQLGSTPNDRGLLWLNVIGDWAMDAANKSQSQITRTDGVITSIDGITNTPESRAFWSRELKATYEESDAKKDELELLVQGLGYQGFTVEAS